MLKLCLLSVIAGIFWGTWPLVMNRSGLSGNVSSAVFAGVAFLAVLPLAIKSGWVAQSANLKLAVLAGILGALGLIAFNRMLATASIDRVGMLFVIMILTQTAIPSVYQLTISGFSASKAAGFIAAIIAAILLTR